MLTYILMTKEMKGVMQVELQFEKRELTFLNQVIRSVKEQELTQEIRLTESMPDVGRVIAGWGQVILRSKEWQGSRIGVTGGVMAWVLYAPEDGSEPRMVNTWLPFQLKWDGAETDREGPVRVQALLRFVDGRNLSARKLLIRAGISCLAEALSQAQAAVYSPAELPGDVELLRRSYPLRLPKETGEKTLSVEETLDPGGLSIRQILSFSLRPEITEARVSGDKIVIRGTGSVHLLLQCADGSMQGKDFLLPFSTLAELDKIYEPDARCDVWMAVTGLEVEMAEERIGLKAGLTGQYVVSERTMLELVEDAYSPRRDVGLRQEELYLPVILDERTERITAQADFQNQVMEPVDCSFLPEHPAVVRNGDRCRVGIQGRFQLLGRDPEGMLRAASEPWTGGTDLDADMTSQLDVLVSSGDDIQMIRTGTGAEARCEAALQITALSRQGMPMITALELGAERETDADRPSLILCRAGDKRLWDIAKTTGASMGAIMEANGLSGEPEDRRMLLIPVS